MEVCKNLEAISGMILNTGESHKFLKIDFKGLKKEGHTHFMVTYNDIFSDKFLFMTM